MVNIHIFIIRMEKNLISTLEIIQDGSKSLEFVTDMNMGMDVVKNNG